LFQGIQVRKDFNFTEEAKGSNRNFTRAFNTTVTDRIQRIYNFLLDSKFCGFQVTELIVKVRIEFCYSGRVSLQR
jgi:hypothetical protein